jgi:hypothetical protein
VLTTRSRLLANLLILLCLICASGATCQRPLVNYNPFAAPGPSAPQVLPQAATREQIVAAVNGNSSRVQSLSASNVSITVPNMMGLPLLSGNIAAQRPGRFRLTAGSLNGPELDLGSNDELFWLWVRRNQPPAVYFCRHSQFGNSSIRQILPVEPSWLLSALGMVDIDPGSVFDGPLPSPRGNGTVELRTTLASAAGNLQRVLLIDARRAWVVEQHIYDQAGTTLLASARADSHRYYPEQQVSLPDRISLELPTANMKLAINLGQMQINQLQGDGGQLWTLPTIEGHPQYDLGGALPGTPLPGTPLPGQAPPPQTPTQPLSKSIIPSAYAGYPTTPYPVMPAYGSGAGSAATAASNAPLGPLPRYGERNRVLR